MIIHKGNTSIYVKVNNNEYNHENYKPYFFDYDGDDDNGCPTYNDEGYMASGFGIFTSGADYKEFATSMLVDGSYTNGLNMTAEEVLPEQIYRVGARQHSVQIPVANLDLMLSDYEGNEYIFKPGRVNTYFSDVHSRLTNEDGDETFSWPIYFTDEAVTAVRYTTSGTVDLDSLDDGWGVQISSSADAGNPPYTGVRTVPGRMTKLTGPPGAWRPEIVITADIIDDTTKLEASGKAFFDTDYIIADRCDDLLAEFVQMWGDLRTVINQIIDDVSTSASKLDDYSTYASGTADILASNNDIISTLDDDDNLQNAGSNQVTWGDAIGRGNGVSDIPYY